MKVKDIVSEDGPIAGQPQMGKVTKTQPGVAGAPGTVTVAMPNGVTQTIPTNMISMGPDGKPMVNQQQQTQSNQQDQQTTAPTPNGQPPIAMGQDLAMAEEGSEDIKSVLAQQKTPYYVDMTTGMVNAGGSRPLKIRVDPALDQGPDAGEGSSPVVLQPKQGGNKAVQMSKEEAVEEFEALFLEKTGNPWHDRTPDRFKKRPGQFSVMELGIASDSAQHTEKALKRNNSSKLPATVGSFMSLITDLNMMKSTMMEMEIDLDKMPLGALSRAQIEKGYTVLSDLLLVLQVRQYLYFRTSSAVQKYKY